MVVGKYAPTAVRGGNTQMIINGIGIFKNSWLT
jgi:hypothetical protein